MNKNHVLLIGSGADLNGRRLGSQIDAGHFGLIARCNYLYGDPLDIGHRTDFLFTRRSGWLSQIPPGIRYALRECIIINEGKGVHGDELAITAQEAGVERASCGLIAAAWLLRRGYRVSAIGFGFSGGKFAAEKKYPSSAYSVGKQAEHLKGRTDINPNYNWPAENKWLARNVTLL